MENKKMNLMQLLRRRSAIPKSVSTLDMGEGIPLDEPLDLDDDLKSFKGSGEDSNESLFDGVDIPDPFDDVDDEELVEVTTRPDPKEDRMKFLRSYLTNRTLRKG